MSLTVYHLKTCDSCKKAIKALTAAGKELTLIDVRADGVPSETLAGIIEKAGWETVLNTRSTTWRGLDAASKEGLDASKAAALMGEHPTLIKRPVITDGETLTVGWKPDQQAVWID
ncbi:MAG: Spx/MgsR family RNA polymerase-binding regulatory protein [Maricaulaceae bacterium]